MSVRLSWARTDPSRISTRAWTMLWGWMRTPSAAGLKSNSQRASMSSSPLFISVAESTVTFLPIFQRGWARASSTGFPPELAQRRPEKRPAGSGQDDSAHVGRSSPGQALENAAVLGIDGDDLGPGLALASRAEGPRRRPWIPCWPGRHFSRPGRRPASASSR